MARRARRFYPRMFTAIIALSRPTSRGIWGIDLVEASDLTVRANKLYRKTIAGLEPVHTLLRYVDDRWCDPVSLRPDSLVGVPGLLDCISAGTVAMVNGVGTGIAESPAMRSRIAELMPQLIGEEAVLKPYRRNGAVPAEPMPCSKIRSSKIPGTLAASRARW